MAGGRLKLPGIKPGNAFDFLSGKETDGGADKYSYIFARLSSGFEKSVAKQHTLRLHIHGATPGAVAAAGKTT